MMAAPAPPPDAVLRLCADAGPAPWYPSQYAKATGTDRDSLDEPLNHLRLAGLVRLTDWQPGLGQGYVLTEAGRAVLANPRALDRLRHGDAPAPPRPAAAPRAAPRQTAWDRGEAVRGALLAGDPTPVTWALMAVQVLVFVVGLAFAQHEQVPLNQYLATGESSVLNRLALSALALVAGEWWRLLTYALVHVGALHLMMNLYGHYALGPVIERMYGSVRFLALYVLSALGGGVAAVLLSPRGGVAGSSGALCGLIGAFAAFTTLNRRHLGPAIADASRRWLTNTLILMVLISLVPRVSWQGHLGGAVVGLVAGVLLNFQRFGTLAQRWVALLAVLLVPIAAVTPLYERGLLRFPESERQEAADFMERITPAVNQIRQRLTEVLDEQVEPLRDLRPAARDPNQVRAALDALGGLKSEEREVVQLVEWAGPYRSPNVEQARLATRDLVKLQLLQTELLEQCLQRGEKWHQREEEELQNTWTLATEADLRWRHLFRH